MIYLKRYVFKKAERKYHTPEYIIYGDKYFLTVIYIVSASQCTAHTLLLEQVVVGEGERST
jgi:hypothetical protein